MRSPPLANPLSFALPPIRFPPSHEQAALIFPLISPARMDSTPDSRSCTTTFVPFQTRPPFLAVAVVLPEQQRPMCVGAALESAPISCRKTEPQEGKENSFFRLHGQKLFFHCLLFFRPLPPLFPLPSQPLKSFLPILPPPLSLAAGGAREERERERERRHSGIVVPTQQKR